MAYLIFMPFVHRWIYVYQRWHAVTIKGLTLKWNSQTPISPDEYDRKVEEVRELNQRLDVVTQSNDTLQSKVRSLTDQVVGQSKPNDDVDFVKIYKNARNSEVAPHFINLHRLSFLFANGEVYLDDLSSEDIEEIEKLIAVGFANRSKHGYKLTDAGRNYLNFAIQAREKNV
ncbi:hypothetical protein JOS77_06735 [Chromobacterium haemolyticum]|nr:hypothetical protein JOS77_06735 [Chromobacterium haemolyticum]